MHLRSLFFALLVCGCGDGDDAAEEETATLGLDACEHIVQPAARQVAAEADASAQLPIIEPEHVRLDVLLPDAAKGFLRVEIDAAGEYGFFLDRTVLLQLTLLDEPLVPEATGAGGECAEVQDAYPFDLDPGAYRLDLGPSSESSVGLVVIGGVHAD
jgi:hypothetical protein